MRTAIILIVILFTYGCSNNSNLIIGGKYVKRHILNEDNPFEKPTYDTVTIIDIQNGWVKYRYSDDTSYYPSTRVKYFIEDTKLLTPCN